jgi:hypothetical protein
LDPHVKEGSRRGEEWAFVVVGSLGVGIEI